MEQEFEINHIPVKSDCMGQPTNAYVEAWTKNVRGQSVMGTGQTEEQAIEACRKSLEDFDDFYAKPALDRLGEICVRKNPINAIYIEEALRCIHEILSRGQSDEPTTKK